MVDKTAPAELPLNEPAAAIAAAPEPAAASAPVAAATVDANAPAPAAAPAADTTEKTAVPEKAASPAEPKVEPGLLENFDKAQAEKAAQETKDKPAKPADDKTAAKPDDKAAAESAKDAGKSEDKPAEAAKVDPIAYNYKLPETLRMDHAQKGEFSTVLDEFRADPAKNVQKIIDFGAKAMTDFATNYAKETLQHQFDTFNDTKRDWEKHVMADPELGGAGHETALATVARVRDAVVSSAKPGTEQYKSDWKEYEHFLAATGAGSHPALLRILHNAARFVDEPQGRDLPTNIKPPKDSGKAPSNFKETMYDNPRSNPNGRQ